MAKMLVPQAWHQKSRGLTDIKDYVSYLIRDGGRPTKDGVEKKKIAQSNQGP